MNVKFVHVQSGKSKVSTREKELQSAEIRSHAAKISHRSKALKGQGQSRSATTDQRLVAKDDGKEIQEKKVAKYMHARTQQLNHVRQVQSWQDQLWPMFEQLTLYADSSYSRNLKVKSFITLELFDFFSDEAMFHIGAAYLHHQHEYLTGPDIKPSKIVLSHVTQGLKIIRERLSKGIMDNATLLAILFVPFCEDNSQSVEHFELHWHWLVKLLRYRIDNGGIENTPGGHFLNNVIEAWEPFGRFWLQLDIPMERQLERKPFIIPDQAYDITLLPPGIQSLYLKDVIGVPAINLALNLVDLLGSKQIQPSKEELGYSYQHTWRLYDVKKMTDDYEPSTEMIVSQALQIYCIRLMGPRGIAGIVPRSGRWHMTSAMEACRKRREGEEERALFWSWIVTLDCWRLPNGQLSSWGTKLRDVHLHRFSWVESSAHAAEILNDYFSDDKLLSCFREMVLPIKTVSNIENLIVSGHQGPKYCRDFSYG